MSTSTRDERASKTRPRSHGNSARFVAGVVLVSVGVSLQVPDVLSMKGPAMIGAMEQGMTMTMSSTSMTIGMLTIVAGLVVATMAILSAAPRMWPQAQPAQAKVIEHVTFRPLYVLTCAVLAIALVIDIMKPLTLGFVLPGMRREYGIALDTASVLPLVALSGTAIGSVAWGFLGDRYGRRPVMLLATLLFLATSACGAMPSFGWNLVMCFLMGASAGGLLPVVFTLVAELTPSSYRGWMAVTIGSIGGLGGYLAASNAARYLEPAYGWRALWLIGLPTGVLLLALSPFLPESPLFLLHSGRQQEAERILARYGSRLVDSSGPVTEVPEGEHSGHLNIRGLFQRYPVATAVIGTVGSLWGVVNFGFMTLLPDQLRDAGLAGGAANSVLANAALYSAPGLVLVVLLYAGWSSRGTLTAFFVLMALALAGMVTWASFGRASGLLTLSIGGLVLSLTAVNAMILPYSAEIYPTRVRATGAGFAGAATKIGGVLGPFVMLVLLRIRDGLWLPAGILAVASLCGAVLMVRFGPKVAVHRPWKGRLSAKQLTP